MVTCDSYPLLDLRDEELILVNPKLRLEVNTVGEGSFTIYKNHPYYGKLNHQKSIFEVSDEIGVIFRGRMTEYTQDFVNGKAVDLEGAMAFFNDSVVRPFKFPEDFLENAEYTAAAESGNVVAFFLGWLIDRHNEQVESWQQLKLGNVTVADPNNYITRSDNSYSSTWNILKTKLFESALGGYLCIRYEKDGNYIDYLKDFELINTQEITFGENLLDLSSLTDSNETYSAIIPIGAGIESEDESTEEKKKLTISSLADGDITSDIVKSGDTLYSKSAVEKYGWKYAPVEKTTWPDVTKAENLRSNGVEWLTTQGILLSNTIEISAVDLHFSDAAIQSFRIYRKIKVTSSPHGLSGVYQLPKLEPDLLNPQNTKITVGKTLKTLTDLESDFKQDAAQKIESTKNEIKDHVSSIEKELTDKIGDEVDEGLVEVRETISEQHTSILNTCESIILSALTSYTETSNFEEFKQTVESQLQLLANEMTLKFTETISQIENVNGDLQSKFNTITKYFTFNINGLVIGQVDNPYKVVIDNDRYSMFVNGMEVLWFDGDGQGHIPELTITKLFNLFGFLIDQDANGNVNCEYIGG